MITYEERREVVARLREWLAIPWYERPWGRDAMQSLGKMVGAVPGENIVERIADLIEPVPERTCRMIDNGAELCCSECDWRHDYDDEPKFCAGCGAKVAEQ